ncbi:MAG: MipA/OmpV family protein [Chromatocurvus sp.]
MIRHRVTGTSLGVFAATLAAAASAGEWGLGIGVAAQQTPQIGTDPQVFVLPFPSYQGDRLSVDFASASYALVQSEEFRFSLEGQLRFDGYDPDDSDELTGLKRRKMTFDAGLGLSITKDWGRLNVKLLGDAFGVHEGYELSTSYEYPVTINRWTIVPSLGLTMPSDDLVQYYYGVRVNEANNRRPAYQGKSVVNAVLGVNVLYQLGDRWQLMGGGQYVRLGDGITDSPIIERDHELTVYSAIVYRF